MRKIEDDIIELEAAMAKEARGDMTSATLKREFTRRGWTVDLLSWSDNALEACAPDGTYHVLYC